MRHERLQNSLCGSVKRVGDLAVCAKGGSNVLLQELANMACGVHPDTPVHVFREVSVNRIGKRSRRADLVFYIPKVRLVYVEYKTVEDRGVSGESTAPHDRQLRETHNNLIANLAYNMSLPRYGGADSPALLGVTTLLLTRRFWSSKKVDDVVVAYSSPRMTGVREREDPSVLVSILSSMGKQNPSSGARRSARREKMR